MPGRNMYNRYANMLDCAQGRNTNMTIESIFSHISGSYEVSLMDKSHKSVEMVKEKQFFISPNFTEYHHDPSPRIVIFSAPGATGKSTLARYISYIKKSLYWNLADIHLGENSYNGTLINAFGPMEYSGYISALQKHDTLLIVDAFDESEINSGENMIHSLIDDIDANMKNCQNAYTAFFSRTETSQNLGLYLLENNIPYVHYEIGLFNEFQAQKFVEEYIENKEGNCSSVQKNAIEQFFHKIKNTMKEEEYQNFIGYAPVLQSIAISIVENDNTMALLNELENNRSITIVRKIMGDLVEREQLKFKNGFLGSVDDESKKLLSDVELYSPYEQFVRIILSLLGFRVTYDDFQIDKMPMKYVDTYVSKIESFLPQHTFLYDKLKNKQKTFVGPAFRDYTIANIFLRKEYFGWANEYIIGNLNTSHFPSQLFWDFYTSQCNEEISLSHIPYLYESFKSRNKANERSTLELSAYDGDGTAVFESVSLQDGEITDHQEFNVIDLNEEVVFNKLIGVSISGEIKVKLESSGSFVIMDSSIDCSEITMNMNQIEMNISKGYTAYFMSENPIISTNAMPSFKIRNDGVIKTAFPNIAHCFSLIQYKFDREKTDQNFDLFVFNIKRIFSYFRQHRKDTLGKDHEKIDNHVVANPLRKSIFKYLCAEGVIYKEGHLYKVNKEIMKSAGISWSGDSANMNKVFVNYQNWIKTIEAE